MPTDWELSPPPKRVFSEGQDEVRRWKLVRTVFVFIAGYAVLHKILIPSVLRFTVLQNTPYAALDLSVISTILLASSLFWPQNVAKRFVPFLLGTTITFAIMDFIGIFTGNYPAWLSITRLVTATPVALGCLVIIGQRGISTKSGWLALGLCLSLGLSYFTVATDSPMRILPFTRARTVPLPSDSELKGFSKWKSLLGFAEPQAPSFSQLQLTHVVCGAMGLRVQKADRISNQNGISILPCGLTPIAISPTGDNIDINNTLDKPVVLRLVVSRNDGRRRTLWTRVAKARTHTLMPLEKWQSGIAMLFSESLPKAGVVALVGPALEGQWELLRKPLRIVKRDNSP